MLELVVAFVVVLVVAVAVVVERMYKLNSSQLTIWLRAREIIRTQYGMVTTERWVEMEAARINKKGDGLTAFVARDKTNGLVALFRLEGPK